jgi:hypothetical protein
MNATEKTDEGVVVMMTTRKNEKAFSQQRLWNSIENFRLLLLHIIVITYTSR